MHAPAVSVDITLLYQLGLFLVSFFVLRFFVYRPYLELLSKREAQTSGLQEKSAGAIDKAAQLEQKYESFMREERQKIQAWADEKRRAAGNEEQAIIQTARNKATEELQVARGKIKADAERVHADLTPMVAQYSSELASKLIGREVKVTSAPHGDKGKPNLETRAGN